MSQPLGTFTPRPAQTGDQFQARFAIGRPLFVQVVGVDGARQVKDQQTQATVVKKSITVHVWDLVGGQVSVTDSGQPIHGAPNTVYANVLWMAGAIVDNLEPYVGAPPMAIQINSMKGKSGHNYLTPVAVEGPALQQMQQVFAADPTRIDREVAAKAQAAAAQSAAPAYQQSGFQPMQVQPSAPAQGHFQGGPVYPNGNPPQGGQYPMQQAPAAAQFQAPSGQPGAIANMPAQVAQQWAPVDQAMQQAQFQPPAAAQQPYAPQQAPAADQAAYQATQQPWSPPAQAQQMPPQGQPQFQQAPAQAAPGQPGPVVQNSDVASILAGLAGQQG